jgi:membrane-bound lytic murein transglycosylase D
MISFVPAFFGLVLAVTGSAVAVFPSAAHGDETVVEVPFATGEGHAARDGELLMDVTEAAGAAGADFSHTPIFPVAAPAIDSDVVVDRVLTLDLTDDANDIWDRLRRGFRVPDLDNERVAEQQLFYLGQPDFLKRVLSRGGRYLYYIVDEIERRGMPTELALLPMVESSYNPLAYSRAHASGLWQFIPSTGRHYNLTQDYWIDERRDVAASTNAALDYLQNLYEIHGDWHLALASYNWGEGAVAQAVRKNRDIGLSTEYDALTMPAETRNYIPKLQAIKNIVAAPEQFRFELPYVANEQHLKAVPAPAGIDLAAAAACAEMSLEDFLALNPGYNRPALTAAGQVLIVPTDRADRFAARLGEFAAAGKGWRSHPLVAGEKLEEIARRHDLTLAQLLQINALPANARPSPGHALLVPDGVDPSGALAVSRLLPENIRLAAAEKARTRSSRATGRKAVRAIAQAVRRVQAASKAPPRRAAARAAPRSAARVAAVTKVAATQAKR